MRISDWSSDVCSSDLLRVGNGALDRRHCCGALFRVAPCNHHIGARPGQRHGILKTQTAGAGHNDRAPLLRWNIIACPVRHRWSSPIRQGRPPRDMSSRSAAVPNGAMMAADSEITMRSEEHTSELQSLMRISYAV